MNFSQVIAGGYTWNKPETKKIALALLTLISGQFITKSFYNTSVIESRLK
jgi:hypothetical protein